LPSKSNETNEAPGRKDKTMDRCHMSFQWLTQGFKRKRFFKKDVQ
jgi:hypothetical protein